MQNLVKSINNAQKRQNIVGMPVDIQRKLFIVQGDITEVPVECIVNAANKDLTNGNYFSIESPQILGGGICGAIHKAAGTNLEKECQNLGGAKIGEVKMTNPYNLSLKISSIKSKIFYKIKLYIKI